MERYGSQLKVPDDCWLFAGSVLLLETGTSYELRLTLSDPDGKGAGAKVSRVLKAQTRSEQHVSASARQRHVVPGSGGGTGTAADPFRGLAVASKAAAPAICSCFIPASTKGPGSSTGAACRQSRSCGAGWQTRAASRS